MIQREQLSSGNEEYLVLKQLNRLKTRDWEKLQGIQPQDAQLICRSIENTPVESLQDLAERFGDDALALLEWGYEKAIEWTTRKERKKKKRLQNRIQYVNEPELIRDTVVDKDTGAKIKDRWRYDADLRCGGLMKRIIQARFGDLKIPIALPIVNLSHDGDGNSTSITDRVWAELEAQGWIITRKKLAWYMNSPAWKMIQKAFPTDVDGCAYTRRLNAPVFPGGFILDTPVRCKKITVELGAKKYGDMVTIRDENTTVIDAGKDGSGYIHPDHEIFQQMDRPNKAFTIQFTFINEDGWVAKGILVPSTNDTLINGEPGIVLDWLQIKGKFKAFAKERRKRNEQQILTGSIGVIGICDTDGTIKWGFEQLEKFKNNETTQKIIQGRVDQTLDEIKTEEGNKWLIKQATTGSQTTKAIIKLIYKLQELGEDIHPLQFPTIRRRVQEHTLPRFLHLLTTGACIESPRLHAVIDNSIPVGHCVINDRRFKPGEEVVTFRYPTTLAQGIRTLKIIKPNNSQRDCWEYRKQLIFMNSKDLVNRLQGDDDWDPIAVDNSPDLVELAKHTIDHRVFLVEPKGKKIHNPINSPEGRKYMKESPAGPVGLFTNILSRLLEAGDLEGAIAMAMMVQEAVDRIKRNIEWSDYTLATDISNWEEVEPNVFKFNHKLPEEYLDANGDVDTDKLWDWVNHRLTHVVGLTNQTIKKLLNWYPEARNRKFLHEMVTTGFNQGEGNLVTFCNDYAVGEFYRRRIQDHLGLLAPDARIKDIIPRILKKRYPDIEPRVFSWEEYVHNLRSRAGINQFGNNNKNNYSENRNPKNLPDNERTDAVEQHQERRTKKSQISKSEFHSKLKSLTPQDYADIWVNECTHQQGNLNHAIKVVSWEQSPVMQILGLSKPLQCEFLNDTIIERVINKCTQAEDPFDKLTEIILGSKTHEEHTEVPGAECKTCIEELTEELVRTLRKNQVAQEYNYLKNQLIKQLNHTTHF